MINLKTLLLALCMAGCSYYSSAQDTSKMADIKRLLEVSGSGELGMQMINNLFDVYEKNLPDIDPAFWDSFKKEIKPDDFINLLLPIYDKYYTREDIRELINFYESPIGKKMVASLPQVMQESMKAGEEWGREIGIRVAEKLRKEGKIK